MIIMKKTTMDSERIKMRMLIIFVISGTILNLNCGNKIRTVYFVNVDCSNSTADNYIRDAYRNDFNMIIQKAEGGDVIVLDRISSNSFSTSNPLIIKFPEYSIFGDNKDRFMKITDSLKNIFKANSIKYFEDPVYTETDILNSLSESVIYMRKEEYREFRKIIVIFSDMIQQTSELDLVRNSGDDKQISKLITALGKENKLFNLDSIEVYVSGATFSGLNVKEIDLNQTKFIKEFWKQYFEACNMKFRDEMYQARLGEF